ncbi:MAG: serine/threonine protein kinase [Gemmataceae bacterium]|nr:serine/threonine protein kinase [Gemmataceae bacterium]
MMEPAPASKPEPVRKVPASTTNTKLVAIDTVAMKMPNPLKQTIVTNKPIDTVEGALVKPAGAAKAASMLGAYKLLKKIGQGGMGAVYKGQKDNGPIVAIKVLAKELAAKESYVARFKREADVMKKLNHPNILGCHEYNNEKGYYYIVMDFVEGGSVESWLKKLGKFSIGDAFHIILKTAEGLQHAHEQGLIHRDIKPDNLLITKDGVIKVADLGLAKDTEDLSLTKTGAGAGTPIYMAPEQARDVKHVDARVDIYALGVMFYVFLTGQTPFQGTTFIELISAKEKGKFDSIRKYNNEVPSRVDLIVDKMMSKDPKLRFASCEEVINQLAPLGLHNETLSFLGADLPTTVDNKKPTVKNALTSGPAKLFSTTTAPTNLVGKTSIRDQQEDVEKDVWYWNMVLPTGEIVNKKVTTDQVKMLIKGGSIKKKSEVSKTQTGGYRHAATFGEFMQAFLNLKTTKKANSKTKNRYQQLADEDAEQRKLGENSKASGGMGGTIFGIFFILIILVAVGVGGWFLWPYVFKP